MSPSKSQTSDRAGTIEKEKIQKKETANDWAKERKKGVTPANLGGRSRVGSMSQGFPGRKKDGTKKEGRKSERGRSLLNDS